MSSLQSSDEIFEVFVSMPYGRDDESKSYWNKFYQFAILSMKSIFEGRGYTVNFVRPKEEPSALRLKEGVKDLIERCDICLAVITGLNPNVFWEVGYAESRGKPLIFVVEEGVNEAEYSPVLVADALKEFYDGRIFNQPRPDKAQVLDFQERLLRFFDIGVKVVKGSAQPSPQYRVFSDRIGAQLARAVAKANNTIDLITSNLSYFADIDNFVAKVNGETAFAFDHPVEQNVRLRILALNPDSVIAEYRAKQLGMEHDVSGYREQLRNSARFFYHRYMKSKNVDMRIYDDLPLQITFIIDGRVITSFVSRGHQARHNIHVEFDLEFKGARASFEEHFAEVLASQAQTFHISRFAWAQKI